MRIVAIGDSITYGAGDEKGGWVQRIREILDRKSINNAESDYSVQNLGISGDTTDDLMERIFDELPRRIDDEEENVVIFAIGINDSQFMEAEKQHHVPIEKTKQNLQSLVDFTKKYTQKIVFIGLTPVDESKVTPIPWNLNKFYRSEFVKEYDKVVRGVAEANNLLFLDMFTAFSGLDDYKSLLIDGLHPNTKDYEEVTKIILNFLIQNKVIR